MEQKKKEGRRRGLVISVCLVVMNELHFQQVFEYASGLNCTVVPLSRSISSFQVKVRPEIRKLMTTARSSNDGWGDLDGERINGGDAKIDNWYFETIIHTAMTRTKMPRELKAKTVADNSQELELTWKSDSCAKAYVVTFSSYLSK